MSICNIRKREESQRTRGQKPLSGGHAMGEFHFHRGHYRPMTVLPFPGLEIQHRAYPGQGAVCRHQ